MPKRGARIKLILILSLGVSLGAVGWYFFHSRQVRNLTRLAMPQTAARAVMALSKVHQTSTKDGVVQWKLDADSAEMEADTGKMILQAPEINFFLEDGSQVRLTARTGILHTGDNNMEVQGNVQLRNDRYTLVTEALAYDHLRREITTNQAVRITGKAIELQATAMTYDLNVNQARFDGPVKGILHENPIM